MNLPLVAIVAASLVAIHAGAADQRPGLDQTVVKMLTTALPAGETERGSFLYDSFAGKPEAEQFQIYRAEGWKTNFAAFAQALVQKADAQHLDSKSLLQALKAVREKAQDYLAYLPVGAYQSTLGSNLVWIIVVKWESINMPEPFLIHIRVFAFDQKTLKQVGYASCM